MQDRTRFELTPPVIGARAGSGRLIPAAIAIAALAAAIAGPAAPAPIATAQAATATPTPAAASPTPAPTVLPPPRIAGRWSITRTWYRGCPGCGAAVTLTTPWTITQAGNDIRVDRGPRGAVVADGSGGGLLVLDGLEQGATSTFRFWYASLRVTADGNVFEGAFNGSEQAANPCGDRPPVVTCFASAGWIRGRRLDAAPSPTATSGTPGGTATATATVAATASPPPTVASPVPTPTAPAQPTGGPTASATAPPSATAAPATPTPAPTATARAAGRCWLPALAKE